MILKLKQILEKLLYFKYNRFIASHVNFKRLQNTLKTKQIKIIFKIFIGNFSKFILKPSLLSQHTANFNKNLEQIPLPHKLEKIDLLNSNECKQIKKKKST